jgi:cbb3-type cytochrome oxidase subunit 3
MPALRNLVVRDATSNNGNITPLMMNLMIALVVLFVAMCLLGGSLFVLRTIRRSRKASEAAAYGDNSNSSSYRRLTIETKTSSFVAQEKRGLIENSNSPPPSPLPEIRITFPDELDNKTGRPQSGRVVVVRMGDHNAVGLEPVQDPSPPYEQAAGGRFQSLDLERMGGLKEKEFEKQYS